jgi:hypothetical protein
VEATKRKEEKRKKPKPEEQKLISFAETEIQVI